MAKVKSRLKDKSVKHFIREWRKFRGLTLERLAERIDVTHGAIAQLERGEVNYTQPMLEIIADALNCQPADLIGRPPNKEFGIKPELQRIVEIAESASPEQRQQIEQVAEMLAPRRTGTGG